MSTFFGRCSACARFVGPLQLNASKFISQKTCHMLQARTILKQSLVPLPGSAMSHLEKTPNNRKTPLDLESVLGTGCRPMHRLCGNVKFLGSPPS